VVWQALGDVEHYVEPFAGSLAVLLQRPHLANRPYHSETVNDLDALLVNAWRAIQLDPDGVAEAASWPVSEVDLQARHYALVDWRTEKMVGRMRADPGYYDSVMAGWWLWGLSSWIGGGWCSGKGPWMPVDGIMTKVGRPGVASQLPHLSDSGRGVNAPQLREPGVGSGLPHLGNDGRGVNHAGLREPGVDYHPITMPKLREWMGYLCARLRHVRILCGDWRRALTGGATKILNVSMGGGHCGIFLDPPYADSAGRVMDIYTEDSGTVAHDVADWALAHGDDERYRIVMAGFEGEHAGRFVDSGWREVEWYQGGFLQGGMGNTGKGGSQMARDRLWMSPHCLGEREQMDLFAGG
jgi:hypothetical protein